MHSYEVDYPKGMDGTRLTPEQRDKLVMLLSRHRDDLIRLRKRMEARGWYTADPTYNGVIAAAHALQAAISALPEPPMEEDVKRMLGR